MNVILTLVDKDYYPGLAGLVNSLLYRKFAGLIVVGASEPFPSWFTAALEPGSDSSCEYRLGDIRLVRVPLQSSEHIVHCKPAWIAEMAKRFSDCERIVFIDADIIVNVDWTYFEHWIDCGVALCADVNYLMPSTDPIRTQWVRILNRSGRAVRKVHDLYFNSGFLGLSRNTVGFAQLWADIYAENVDLFGDTSQFRNAGREHVFMSANQDTLNLAAMATDGPVSIMGPSAMGFVPGFNAMHHPLGPDKPWRRSFVREALLGNPPRGADKEFWRVVNQPIRPYSNARVAFVRASIKLAAAIGRFVRRPW